MRGCPKDEILLRYARGESNAAEAEEVHKHADHCLSCQDFISAHDQAEDPEPPPAHRAA